MRKKFGSHPRNQDFRGEKETKNITSTENYIHLEEMLYKSDANDQFTVKVADTMEDAIKLVEVGFEFHAEVEGYKLFRKRK